MFVTMDNLWIFAAVDNCHKLSDFNSIHLSYYFYERKTFLLFFLSFFFKSKVLPSTSTQGPPVLSIPHGLGRWAI